MKTLTLLRHAKAVASGAADDDAARELAPRGHADAARLAKWLAHEGSPPDAVLCSPATRTRQTWEDVAPAFPPDLAPVFPGDLYLAHPRTLLARLHALPETARHAVLIGHNPGLEALALHLARKPESAQEDQRLRTLCQGLPTCALTRFVFKTKNWPGVAEAQGHLTVFLRPKDL